MWNDFILISDTETVNGFGDVVKVETERHVYGEETSVGMKEFYQGQAVGFKPEIKVTLTNWLDYHGEHRIRYTPFGMTDPITFTVIRTYRNGEAIELTLEREVDKP